MTVHCLHKVLCLYCNTYSELLKPEVRVYLKALPKEFTQCWLSWSPPHKSLYSRVFKPVPVATFLHWLTSSKQICKSWFSRAQVGNSRSAGVGFSMSYRLQQPEVCQSLWPHVHFKSVITLTARGGRQKLHTTNKLNFKKVKPILKPIKLKLNIFNYKNRREQKYCENCLKLNWIENKNEKQNQN